MHIVERGFTLVELLIVVAILAVLSGAAYIGIQRSQVRVMNEKVVDDLAAISNALEQYRQDYGGYPVPIPGGNKNLLCFDEDMAYAHDCAGAVFLQAQIDNNLMTKRYLQEVPGDPRTGSRYAYGVTTDGRYFQVAGVVFDNDGVFRARVVGNLDAYPFLPGLIRSYHGPQFVSDGESYLPYSPDHLSVTAHLSAVTGTVTIDGDPAGDGDMAPSGSTIQTSAASAAVLYFSDGSVTFLDAGTTLRLLPGSEVAQNDEDGIITKIRLKLFTGKIWNKVVRLASQSEFNVETTSAIAGVRGTEFGINADASEFIVLSGEVLARRMTRQEQVLADTGSYIGSAPTLDFESDQRAVGDGMFRQFGVPGADGAMSDAESISPEREEEIVDAYYSHQLGLSSADTPYIVKVERNGAGRHTVHVAFNGFESDGTRNVDGFEIFGSAQTAGIRSLKEGALDAPLLTVTDVTYSPADEAYLFDTVYNASADSALHDAEVGKPENIILRAYDDVGDHRTYSALSWPLLGFLSEDATDTVEFDNSQVYDEFFGVAEIASGQDGSEQLPAIQFTFSNGSIIPLGQLGSPNSLTIHADTDCDWTLETGGGGLVGITEATSDVVYRTIDLSNESFAEISQRFSTSTREPVSVRCTETGNANNTAVAQVEVSYEFFSVSTNDPNGPDDPEPFRYSQFAMGGASWQEAVLTCSGYGALSQLQTHDYLSADDVTGLMTWANAHSTDPASAFPGLSEGGYGAGQWRLPDKATYDLLDGAANDDKTDPSEVAFWCGQWGGSSCSGMPSGVAAIWLLEPAGADLAYRVISGSPANPSLVSIAKSQEPNPESAWLGFRCVTY